MDMKKVIAATVMATVVGTTAVGAASAAVPAKATAVQVKSSVFTINYAPATVRSLLSNGETLVSIRDISTALGASLTLENGKTIVTLNDHTFAYKVGDKQANVDGKKIILSQQIKSIDGVAYVAVRPLVQSLGGTMGLVDGKLAINTVKLLTGGENARFVNATEAIVSVYDADLRTDYLVDITTGKSAQLMSSRDYSDLVPAPNGMKAAYLDSDGAVYVLNLSSMQSQQVSKDTSIKPELAWASDSSVIYFLQGDKGSVIAKLDIATGTITKLVEDKVDYKSALGVSADGKKFTYLVTTPSKSTADSTDLDQDVVAIDTSSEQMQVYLYDTTIEKPEAVQLTTAKDDKVFLQSDNASKVYYLSVADENSNATVVSVDKNKKMTTLFAEGDAEQILLAGGKLYVLTAVNDDSSAIYEVDLATGSKKLLYNTPADASDLVVYGSQIIITLSDGLYTNVGNTWKPISK